jgi:hypothetical protein
MNGSATIRLPIAFRPRSLPVSGGASVVLARPFVELYAPTGPILWADCFIDTGAAVSIMSGQLRSIFPVRTISAPGAELTVWNGRACDFGETDIRLVDRHRRVATAALPLVGKFLRAPVPFHSDRFVILGLNFLMENAGRLEIAGQPWNLAGHLDIG